MNQKAFTPLFWRNANICLHSAKRAGFTLLELIMVVLIVAILATLAIPQYIDFKEKAIATEAINTLGAMKNAQFLYKVEEGRHYSMDLDDLGIVVNESSETGKWSYDIDQAVGPLFPERAFSVYALRNTGPYKDTFIGLSWDDEIGLSWYGDHPGVPKN